MIKQYGYKKGHVVALFLITVLWMLTVCAPIPTCADQSKGSMPDKINVDRLCWSLEDVKGKIGCSAQDFIIKGAMCEIEALLDMEDDLNLDTDQRHEIAKRYRKFKRSSRLCQAKLNMTSVQLSETLQEKDVDPVTMMKHINATKNLCSKLTDRAVSALIDMKRILTPEQRQMEKKILFPASRKNEGQYIVNPCGQ